MFWEGLIRMHKNGSGSLLDLGRCQYRTKMSILWTSHLRTSLGAHLTFPAWVNAYKYQFIREIKVNKERGPISSNFLVCGGEGSAIVFCSRCSRVTQIIFGLLSSWETLTLSKEESLEMSFLKWEEEAHQYAWRSLMKQTRSSHICTVLSHGVSDDKPENGFGAS